VKLSDRAFKGGEGNVEEKLLQYMYSGVSIKIRVAGRLEESIRLYHKEAFTPFLVEGFGCVHPLKISKFQCPKTRFPAF